MPKNTDVCKECGYEYGLHSAGERCPKNGGQLVNEKLEFFATHFEPEISETDQLRARIAELTESNARLQATYDHVEGINLRYAEHIQHLTAFNESMQTDARKNTETINMLMAQLAEVNEENRGLRQMLHMEAK